MKLILLSREKLAIVDDCDYDAVSPHKWTAHLDPRTGIYYAVATVGGKHIKMHRMILSNIKAQIDHRNRNGLDNRRNNLRPATKSQNMANRIVQNNRSGYKGVGYHKQSGKWTAQIGNGRSGALKYLGIFVSPEDAARSYDCAALARWGEFALTNKQMGLL